MLGLRYLACSDCGAVCAVPDDPTTCPRCGAAGLEPIPSNGAAAAYFAAGIDDGES